MNFRVGQKALQTFERFTIPEPNTGCLLWTGAVNNKGYGILQAHNEYKGYAHRFAYMAFNGAIGDKYVCHKCDMPSCCNPDHLWLGTQTDNMQDARAKGRHCCITSREAYLRGADIGISKLTDTQARRIFLMRGVSERQMATMFGVSRNSIRLIRNGRTWRHVTASLGANASGHKTKEKV